MAVQASEWKGIKAVVLWFEEIVITKLSLLEDRLWEFVKLKFLHS